MFSTTLGTFRDINVPTANGVAHTVLVAGGEPGVAQITVQPLGVPANPTIVSYQFVATRAELSTAREYVEIVAPGYMQYSTTTKMIGAAAPHRGVSLRYREVLIQADDLQYDITNYSVAAKNATIHIGKFSKDLTRLYFVLNTRHGYGTANFKAPDPEMAESQGNGLAFLSQKDDGTYSLAQPVDQFGLVEISGADVHKSPLPEPDSLFQIKDISTSPSTVSARRAVIFPKKGIQFESAQLYVANAKIVKLPYFVVNFTSSSGPLVTDGLFSINDNQIGINYPQYLSLRPGFTSDFRFHMGDRYGVGLGSDSGAFLDYEIAWDQGDDMQGGFTLGGIGRDDWDVDLHQYWHMDRNTTVSAEFNVPAGQGFFGSGNVTHQFDGFSAILTGDHSQTFTGFQATSQNYAADLGTDPRRVAGTPLRYSVGLISQQSFSDDEVLGARQQQGSGVTSHFTSDAIPLDKFTTLTTTWTVSKLYGMNESRGLTLLGAVNVGRRFGRNASVLLTYNYTQDNFTDVELGRNMFSGEANYSNGKYSASLLASKSLGLDRLDFYGDLSYKLSNLWRLSYNYTSDRYLDSEFLDSDIGIGYKIGWREIGIVWSRETKRFGIQFSGAAN